MAVTKQPPTPSGPGVAGVDGIGGYEKQYHVQPDPAKLIGLNLSFREVAEALDANNANRGAGYLKDNGEGYVMRLAGRLESMEEIGNVVVATRQLRFNELLAGTRGDLAVKIFGEEFGLMLQAANQIAAIQRGTRGAEDVSRPPGCRSSRSR